MVEHSRPRVLLLGATGLLGSHLATQLPARFATSVPAPRSGDEALAIPGVRRLSAALEATDRRTLDAVMAEAEPDVVVNCVAITPGSPLAGDPETVVAVNSLFPHQLASMVRARRGRLIHLSTDAVFSGAKGNYREDDAPDPIDLYGRSKLLGEVAGPGCLTIRTSFFGRSPKGHGLIEWLIAQRHGSIDGYTDYVFSGMPAPTLATMIADLVEKPLEGVLHVGGPAISKYDLLTEATRALGLDVHVRPVQRGAIDRSLDSTRFVNALRRHVPTLAEMMRALSTTVPEAESTRAHVS